MAKKPRWTVYNRGLQHGPWMVLRERGDNCPPDYHLNDAGSIETFSLHRDASDMAEELNATKAVLE